MPYKNPQKQRDARKKYRLRNLEKTNLNLVLALNAAGLMLTATLIFHTKKR